MTRADTAPCRTVIGIADNIVQNQDQMTDDKRFMYYLPIDQYNAGAGIT